MLRAVLFDLDDTLFDHRYATQCATGHLCEAEPAFSTWSAEEFQRRHSDVLEVIHREVVAGRMKIDDARRERFRRLLEDAGGDAEALARAAGIATIYRHEYEQHWRPVPGSMELLLALKSRGLGIAVVTNNLTAEQQLKLRRCALDVHIDALITSESAGSAKPEPAIFAAALDALGVSSDEAVMVGDVWDTDIAGALASGVRPLWFNWRLLPPVDPGANVEEIASFVPVEMTVRAICG